MATSTAPSLQALAGQPNDNKPRRRHIQAAITMTPPAAIATASSTLIGMVQQQDWQQILAWATAQGGSGAIVFWIIEFVNNRFKTLTASTKFYLAIALAFLVPTLAYGLEAYLQFVKGDPTGFISAI